MPSNKNQLLARQKANKIETTGKNDVIYSTLALCPVLKNDVVMYQIVEIGFTLDKQCVSMIVLEEKNNQAAALKRFEMLLGNYGRDIRQLRQFVKQLKPRKANEKETDV